MYLYVCVFERNFGKYPLTIQVYPLKYQVSGAGAGACAATTDTAVAVHSFQNVRVCFLKL